MTVVVGAVVPQVDVTLLMPSQTPGKSSSGGDMESFIPDSSSLQDDNWQSSSSAVNVRMINISKLWKLAIVPAGNKQ